AEARAGVRARTDVPEAVDGRRVARVGGQRAPEQVLVECQRAGVRIAVVEVDVRRLQVGRREGDPLADRALEVRHVPRDASLDAVGVTLAQALRPRAVADVELARRVALHLPGQL